MHNSTLTHSQQSNIKAKIRADLLVVKQGPKLSRAQAAHLIKQQKIRFQGKTLKRPGELLPLEAQLEFSEEISLVVGRGAHKLLSPLEELGLSLKDKVVADIGASTGGFTQVSLVLWGSKSLRHRCGYGSIGPKLKRRPPRDK